MSSAILLRSRYIYAIKSTASFSARRGVMFGRERVAAVAAGGGYDMPLVCKLYGESELGRNLPSCL